MYSCCFAKWTWYQTVFWIFMFIQKNISVALSHGQRSFWLQWRQLTPKLISGQNAEKEWWWSAQHLMGYLCHPLQDSWNISEEGTEWYKSQGIKGVLWNTILWIWQSHCPHEFPAAVVAYTRLDHVDTFHQGWAREFKKLHLSKEFLTMNSCRGRGINSSMV